MMHLSQHEQLPALLEEISAIRQRQETLKQAIEALNTRRDNIGKRKATAEALHAEAKTLRQNARQSLRDMIGIPNKATREAKEKELAAQSLADEMLLIAEEETLQIEQEHEQLWQEKCEVETACKATLEQYCKALIEEQMQQLKQQMPVLSLLFKVAPQQCIDQLTGKATLRINFASGDPEISQPDGLIEKTLREAITAEKDEAMTLLLSTIPLKKPESINKSLLLTINNQSARNKRMTELTNRE